MNREVVEIIIFSFSLLILLKPFNDGLVQPLGWCTLVHQNHAAGGWRGEWLHHGGDVCVLVFS